MPSATPLRKPNPSMFGLFIPLEYLAEVGVCPDGERHLDDPALAELGFGLDTFELRDVGDRMERRPAEKDDERPWVGRCLDGFGDVSVFNEAVISILPPPSTARLSNAERTAYNV